MNDTAAATIEVKFFDRETLEIKAEEMYITGYKVKLEVKAAEMYITGYKVKLEKDTGYKGLRTVSFTLNES